MPRLPTIRVIGSQDMSTRLPAWARASFSGMVTVAIAPILSLGLVVRRGSIACGQFGARVAPLRLLVDGPVRHAPERADQSAVEADRRRRQPGAGRFVHEWHELV